MRIGFHVLVLMLGLALAAPAVAQETPPPDKQEPAKPATEAPASAKAAPAEERPAAPAKEVTPAPAKELSLCAKALVPLADSYKKAYDDMQKWIAEVDSKTAAGNEKVRKIQEQIQQNETAITKAKLDGDDEKGKELSKANKQLWTDLEAAKKSESEACETIPKEAAQRAKQYSAEIEAAVDKCKALLK